MQQQAILTKKSQEELRNAAMDRLDTARRQASEGTDGGRRCPVALFHSVFDRLL